MSTAHGGRPRAVLALTAGLLLVLGSVTGAAQPAPGAVGALTQAGWIAVTWSPATRSDEVEGYHIYRSMSAGGPYALLATAPCAPSCEYRDTAIANGVRYFYVVRVFSRDGREGPSSAEVNAVGDTVPPSASLRMPGDRPRFSGGGPTGFAGTAVDAGSGVAAVRLAVRRNDTGEWWGGSRWEAGAKPVYLPAALSGKGPTVKWTVDASKVEWSQGTGYLVRVAVRDTAGFDLDPSDSASLYVDAPAILTASVAAAPGVVTAGQVVHVTLLVANTGGSEATGVTPDAPAATGSAAAFLVTAPTAGTVPSLAPGEFATFSWTFSASGSGAIVFRAGCRGTDAPSGAPATVVPGESNDIMVRLPARLDVVITPFPANVRQGTAISIRVRVTNAGQADCQVTAVLLEAGTPGLVAGLRGPEPGPPFRLKGGESREVTWSASATGAGAVAFKGLASGYDESSGAVVGSALAVSTPVGVASAPATLQLAAGAESAVIQTAVGITAAVRDAQGIPVPGVRVAFGILAGRGRMDPPVAISDDEGTARSRLTMGAEPGMVTVEAQSGAVLSSLSVESILPGGVAQILSRSFIDPSRGETVDVNVRLPRACRVRVRVFNMSGELIATLAERDAQAGDARFTWDGLNAAGTVVPNGVYFISLQAGSDLQSRRISVLKR